MSEKTTEELLADIQKRLKPISPEEAEKLDKQEEDFRRRQDGYKSRGMFDEAHVPKRHRKAVLGTCVPWRDVLSKLQARIGTGFTAAIIGSRGNGKTQIGVELIRMATSPEVLRRSLFCTAMQFFMDVKRAYGKDSQESEVDVIDRYASVSVLVIDEIGRRGETDWENNVLFEVLNRRYNECLDTLLICNLDRAEFAASLGPSLISRLNETGGIIECTWPSFRQ